MRKSVTSTGSRRKLWPWAMLLACLTLQPGVAGAWGWDGHNLICALAEKQLTEAAALMVAEILSEPGELKSRTTDFPNACIWADNVKHSTHRGTFGHHYINVPDDATSIDLARDCPALNCIAVGVQQSLFYLVEYHDVEPRRRFVRTRRAEALRFLGHYVGDMHQPMHVSNASDLGGNTITVRWLGRHSNLHRVWDYEMLNQMGVSHPESLNWLRRVKPFVPEGGATDWMNESLALARSHAYVDHKGRKIRPGAKLGMNYLNRNKPVLLERMSLAATRLARLLNEIAAGGSPVLYRLDDAG